MDQEVYENAENVGTSMKRRKELPGDGANPRAECVTVYGFAFMYSGSCNELRNRAARHPLSIAHARELTHIASLWNGARIRIHRSIALYPNNTNNDGISGLEMIRTSRLHHCGNHLDFQKKTWAPQWCAPRFQASALAWWSPGTWVWDACAFWLFWSWYRMRYKRNIEEIGHEYPKSTIVNG